MQLEFDRGLATIMATRSALQRNLQYVLAMPLLHAVVVKPEASYRRRRWHPTAPAHDVLPIPGEYVDALGILEFREYEFEDRIQSILQNHPTVAVGTFDGTGKLTRRTGEREPQEFETIAGMRATMPLSRNEIVNGTLNQTPYRWRGLDGRPKEFFASHFVRSQCKELLEMPLADESGTIVMAESGQTGMTICEFLSDHALERPSWLESKHLEQILRERHAKTCLGRTFQGRRLPHYTTEDLESALEHIQEHSVDITRLFESDNDDERYQYGTVIAWAAQLRLDEEVVASGLKGLPALTVYDNRSGKPVPAYPDSALANIFMKRMKKRGVRLDEQTLLDAFEYGNE